MFAFGCRCCFGLKCVWIVHLVMCMTALEKNCPTDGADDDVFFEWV